MSKLQTEKNDSRGQMKKFDITIGSVPHREELVADIFYEDIQFAEISEDTGKMLIELTPKPGKDYWVFDLEEFLLVIQEAKKRLTDLGPIPENRDHFI